MRIAGIPFSSLPRPPHREAGDREGSGRELVDVRRDRLFVAAEIADPVIEIIDSDGAERLVCRRRMTWPQAAGEQEGCA